MRVFISDVNDNKPVFAQRLYEVGVDEDADVGLAVVTVSATDEDEGNASRGRGGRLGGMGGPPKDSATPRLEVKR